MYFKFLGSLQFDCCNMRNTSNMYKIQIAIVIVHLFQKSSLFLTIEIIAIQKTQVIFENVNMTCVEGELFFSNNTMIV